MTKPAFEWQISLGNVIQIALLLIAGSIGWATFDARIAANETAIRNGISDGRRIDAEHEMRLRTMETSNARAEERFTSILALLARIDSRLERIEQGDQK